jgi:hypothetical protein
MNKGINWNRTYLLCYVKVVRNYSKLCQKISSRKIVNKEGYKSNKLWSVLGGYPAIYLYKIWEKLKISCILIRLQRGATRIQLQNISPSECYELN